MVTNVNHSALLYHSKPCAAVIIIIFCSGVGMIIYEFEVSGHKRVHILFSGIYL